MCNKLSIFVGSSSEAIPVMNKMAVLLEEVDFSVRLWTDADSFIFGKSIFENLDRISNEVDAAMFIYSDDDRTWFKNQMLDSPRDNVVFEHGFFAGKLGRNKSIIVRCNEPKIPSDLDGIVYAKYDESKPNTLKAQLKKWKDGMSTSSEILNAQKKEDAKEKPRMPPDGVPEMKASATIEIVDIPQGEYRRIKDRKKTEVKFFGISKKLITQNVYVSVMGDNPSNFLGGNLPVENVTLRDAVMFCNALSVKDGHSEVYTISKGEIFWNQDVTGYRLPREMEWEYALGYDIVEIRENLDALAWYKDNSGRKTHDVGLKERNAHGIFDLLGNVWEWCFDKVEGMRVVRGGSSDDSLTIFSSRESAFRKEVSEFTRDSYIGFRVILQKHTEGESHG